MSLLSHKRVCAARAYTAFFAQYRRTGNRTPPSSTKRRAPSSPGVLWCLCKAHIVSVSVVRVGTPCAYVWRKNNTTSWQTYTNRTHAVAEWRRDTYRIYSRATPCNNNSTTYIMIRYGVPIVRRYFFFFTPPARCSTYLTVLFRRLVIVCPPVYSYTLWVFTYRCACILIHETYKTHFSPSVRRVPSHRNCAQSDDGFRTIWRARTRAFVRVRIERTTIYARRMSHSFALRRVMTVAGP